MKLLAKPSDFYDIEINRFGDQSDKPSVEIIMQDETIGGVPPLVDKLNQFINHGYRFTKVELGGDGIGWKYVKLNLEKPSPHKDGVMEDGTNAYRS